MKLFFSKLDQIKFLSDLNHCLDTKQKKNQKKIKDPDYSHLLIIELNPVILIDWIGSN